MMRRSCNAVLASYSRQFVPCGHRPCQLQSIFRNKRKCLVCPISYSSFCIGKDKMCLASAFSLSEDLYSYDFALQIHSYIIKMGFLDDIFSLNNLIKMYMRIGAFSSALGVFEKMEVKNLVSWTLMISGAMQNGEYEFGFKAFQNMLEIGWRPNEYALGSVLKGCVSVGDFIFGLSIYCYSLKTGMERNPFVGSSILNMYTTLRNIVSAEIVFDSMDKSDVGCWNAMLRGYVVCGCYFEAWRILSALSHVGVKMDQFTFIHALQICATAGNYDFVKQVHGLIVRSEVTCGGNSVMNALLDVYFKHGDDVYAFKVFRNMQKKNVISWNTVFGGISHDRHGKELLRLYKEFMTTDLKPNHITFSALFRKSGELLNLYLGLQFYSFALRFGLLNEDNVTLSLIKMFSCCGTMDMARLVFDRMLWGSINLWNELIAGYNRNESYMGGIKAFIYLQKLAVEANECTFSLSLEACCKSENWDIGSQIHGCIVKSGFGSHEYICSSLIKCYVMFGLQDDLYKFFKGPEKLDLASWATIISTLVHQGHHYEAMEFFHSLLEAGEKPDEFIFASIFNSCAGTAAYQQTKFIHALVIKLGYEMNVFVCSAVIDAYAKCTDMGNAERIFNECLRYNDIVIYNTMIVAYGHHGLIGLAIDTFKKMKSANLQPSQSTFISLISACGHEGLVNLGCYIFKLMGLEYGMEPSPGIYGCLVDMLSRNGYLTDAKQIIEEMPCHPWPGILRSLLSGCRKYGDRVLGKWAAAKLLQLIPDRDAAYVLLSKVYSEGGSWEEASKVRAEMVEKGIRKCPGYSWIESL